MAERFDRGILQLLPTDDAKLLSTRINNLLRIVSERIAKLEGRSGEQTIKNSLSLRSEGYTLMDMESQLAGKAAFCGLPGTSRTFEIAKGARREADKQWVATDTGAVILQLKDDGTMIMYANTGLTIGAAFTPTVAISFPGATGVHALVGATHTATGLTTGHVLTATGTNTFAFQALSADAIDIQTFTTVGTNTWTKPTSFTPKWVYVEMWGAGGGGGGAGTAGTTTKRYGGAGGGGGAYACHLFPAAVVSATEVVYVGTGGVGGAGNTITTGAGDPGGIGEASYFGDPIMLFAGAGGGGHGGGSGGGGIVAGGGGGGTADNGSSGSATPGEGGYPQIHPASITAGYPGIGGAGANGGTSVNIPGGWAEHGGGGGGGTNNPNPPTASEGGNSIRGGGGGGGGASVSLVPGVTTASTGGGSGAVFPFSPSGDGGAAGTSGNSPTPGDAGAAGTNGYGGWGGGGGGSTIQANTAGANGGNGGARGGGGGGGGAGTVTGAGGDGGDGGRGEVIVYTW